MAPRCRLCGKTRRLVTAGTLAPTSGMTAKHRGTAGLGGAAPFPKGSRPAVHMFGNEHAPQFYINNTINLAGFLAL